MSEKRLHDDAPAPRKASGKTYPRHLSPLDKIVTQRRLREFDAKLDRALAQARQTLAELEAMSRK